MKFLTKRRFSFLDLTVGAITYTVFQEYGTWEAISAVVAGAFLIATIEYISNKRPSSNG